MRDSEFFLMIENLNKQDARRVPYYRTLYALAESCDATRILECGFGWGCSATAFIASLGNRKNKYTSLVSIDPLPQHITKGVQHFADLEGVDFRLERMRSSSYNHKESICLLYIDGDPSLVMEDFNRFYPLVKTDGYVVIDGYGSQDGPTEAVDKLKDTMSFVRIPYHGLHTHAVGVKE